MIGRFVVLVGISVQEFSRNNCHGVAAGIAYWTLLSLFPVTLGAMALLGHVFRDLEDQARVVDALVGAVPVGSDYLRDTVEQVVRSRGGVGVLATVGMLVSGLAVFSAVRTGINHAWGVLHPARFVTRRYQDLAMFTGVVVLAFLLLLGANPFAGFSGISDLGGELGFVAPPIWWRAVRALIALAATCAALSFLYRYLPNTRVWWRELWPGVLVGALFIVGTNLAFGEMLGLANNYSLVWGSLGALVAALAWAYFSAIGLLLGAQVCSVYGRRHEHTWRLHLHVDESPEFKPLERSRKRVEAFAARLSHLRDRPG